MRTRWHLHPRCGVYPRQRLWRSSPGLQPEWLHFREGLGMTATTGPAHLANLPAFMGCASMQQTREIAPSEVNVPPARFVTRSQQMRRRYRGQETNFVKKERSATWLRVCRSVAVECIPCEGSNMTCPSGTLCNPDTTECLDGGVEPACRVGEFYDILGRCVQCINDDQCGPEPIAMSLKANVIAMFNAHRILLSALNLPM